MVENLTIDELKVILRENRLKVSGIKDDLVERLKQLDRCDDIVREWKLRRARQEIDRLQKEKYEEKIDNTSLRYIIQVRDPKIQEQHEEKKEPRKKKLKKENEWLKEEMSVLQRKNDEFKKEIDQLRQSKSEFELAIEVLRREMNQLKPKKDLPQRENDRIKQKGRARYSPHQLSLLNAQLTRTQRITPSVISKVATETNLTKKQVYDWYYTKKRRIKNKLGDTPEPNH